MQKHTASKVQRFVAPDMGRALKMLSNELGGEAILLASRRVASGVEVVGLPPGAATNNIDMSQLYGERRRNERRANGRRAADEAELELPIEALSQFAAESVDGSTDLSQEDSKALHNNAQSRRSFGDTLARLRSDYPSLLGDAAGSSANARDLDADLDGIDHSPAALKPEIGLRHTASALAEQILQLPHEPARVKGETLPESGLAAVSGQLNFVASARQEESMPIDAIQVELKQLKTLLADSLARNHSETVLPQPAQYIVMQRLLQMGFSQTVITALLQNVSGNDVEALWSACLEQLNLVLPLLEKEVVDGGGLFALVGPLGAGKSSVMAMLLGRFIEQDKAGEVAVISMEGARSDVISQLTSLAGITYLPVDADFSFTQRVSQCSRFRTVLIDTANGLDEAKPLHGIFDEAHADNIKISELLVLPATGEQRYLRHVIQQYNSPHTAGCVLTFYDQAQSIGEIMSLLLSERMQAAYVARGTLLPEHLTVPSKQQMLQELSFEQTDEIAFEVLAPTLKIKAGNRMPSLSVESAAKLDCEARL